MKKDKEYWREKKREQRAKLKVAKESVVDEHGEVTPVTDEWDKVKHPVREAWEIAVVRAQRARKYAGMFPGHVKPSEEVFQSVDWQYEHEGLPAVRGKEAA